MQSSRKINQAIHKMAPLLNGWDYTGLTNDQRTYMRNGVKATVTPGIIILNDSLPIHYKNVAVWECINQIVDQVRANGPTEWAHPLWSQETVNTQGQTVVDRQWTNGKITTEIIGEK